MYKGNGMNLGAISTILVGFGLSGCAADAESANLMESDAEARTHMRYVFLNAEEDGAEKTYRLKIKKDDGSEPVVITTTDPESEEFKTAMAQLKEQGIDLDLKDLDPAKLDEHKLKFDFSEGKEFKFIMKDGPLEIDGLVIDEFKNGDEWVSDDGTLHIIKKLEDGKTVLHVTKEENGEKVFIMKGGDQDDAHESHVEKKIFVIKDEDKPLEEEEAPASK
ncbi:MAG: hypothetical protein EP347_08340 [Alphaproteobacteria bacterium]|nr:MAG: hypothetical protein EP347_08340 [Alphaproteobacteria bacterium]